MITSGDVIALAVVLPLIDVFCVALRLFVKFRRTGTFHADDYFVSLSLVVLLGLSGMAIYGAAYQGLGKEAYNYTPDGTLNTDNTERLSVTKHITKSAAIMVPILLGTAKLSVLFFYRNIFCGKAFNVLSISLIVFVSLYMVVMCFMDIFQCGIRFSVMWMSAKNVAEICLPGLAIGLSNAAIDVLTDLCILVLPIYWIVRLHLPVWKKACVAVIFLFGTITVAVSAVRLAELSIVYPGHSSNPNQFLYLTTIVFYAILEGGLSIVASCLPTFGPLFTSKGRLKLRSRGQYTRSSGTRYPILYKHAWFHRSKPRSTTFDLSNTSKSQFVPKHLSGEHYHLESKAVGNASIRSQTDSESFGENIKVSTKIDQESRNTSNV